MSEKKKYRTWTVQQKLEIVLAGMRGEVSVAEVCREHQISETLFAVTDCGDGSLITTELRPSKAEIARQNLEDTGLAHLVELRLGDAQQTLVDLPGPVDFLFLDGRNDLYLPVLHLIERHMASDALVVADLSTEDPISSRIWSTSTIPTTATSRSRGSVRFCWPGTTGSGCSVAQGVAAVCARTRQDPC